MIEVVSAAKADIIGVCSSVRDHGDRGVVCGSVRYRGDRGGVYSSVRHGAGRKLDQNGVHRVNLAA